MKIPKKVKELPWPEDFHGGREHFKLHLRWPVVEGERLLVIDFMANRDFRPDNAYQARGTGRDFRLVLWKRSGRTSVLYRGGVQGRRKTLEQVMREVRNTAPWHCYLRLETAEEAQLGRWLGAKESANHFMPELNAWVEDALEAEKTAEAIRRGELTDGDWALCPEELPEGLENFIRREVLPQDNILLYKKGNVRGLCYCCGREVRAQRGQKFRRHERATCPACGAKVRCVLQGGMDYKADYVQNIAAIQRGADGQTVFVRLWHLCRDGTARWEDIGAQLQEIARWAIRGCRAAKWQCEGKEGYMRKYRYALSSWERRSDTARVYDGCYIFYRTEDWREIFRGTSLQYCDLEGYRADADRRNRGSNTIRFLLDWARYPAIEKLWKAGWTELIHERIYGAAAREKRYTVSWNADTVGRSLKVPLRSLPADRRALKHVELRALQKAWELCARGVLPERDIPLAVALGDYDVERLEKVLRHVSLRKLTDYLERQRERRREELWVRVEHIPAAMQPRLRDYMDYVEECLTLELDVCSAQVLLPRDLMAAHARTSGMIRHKESEEEKRMLRERAEELQRMAWQDGGLVIRPAAGQEELVAEGEALHHCVAGYAGRMARGETAIFFIRRAEDPDTPLYTLELKNQQVIQCRTKNNAGYERDAEVYAFVGAWLAEKVLKTKKKKAAGAA